MQLPTAPLLPPKLADHLNVAAIDSKKRPFLVPIGHEVFDAARAKLPQASVPAKTFENSAPASLALAIVCVKAKLLVAPSMRVLGASGLYSTRDFVQ